MCGPFLAQGAMGLMQIMPDTWAGLACPAMVSAPIRSIRATTFSLAPRICARCMTATARPAFSRPTMQVPERYEESPGDGRGSCRRRRSSTSHARAADRTADRSVGGTVAIARRAILARGAAVHRARRRHTAQLGQWRTPACTIGSRVRPVSRLPVSALQPRA